MFGTFDGEISVPTELREATQELDALKALLPSLPQSFAMDLEEPEGDQRPPKWPKPGPKGAPGGGKGKRQPQPRGARFGSSWKDNDWRNQGQQGQWEWEPRQPQWTSQQEETQAQQLSKLQAIISMLTTLVLRQEVQLSVCRQDTAYVVFIKTHGQDNLAQSLYAIGQKWHQLKQSSPEKLTAPMRSVLFQHFVETIKQKFQQMLATPSSRSHAQELGLISDNGNAIPALRWDTTSKTHVPDTRIEALQPVEIKALLDQLLILGSKEFVVTRFHGMRKLSEEYSSPTLGMFLEIGNRTSEAKEAWEILHKLNQSAAWMAGGCYLRHERMQLSALAKRLAADGPDHTSNMMLRRNVSDDFNCVVTAQSLLHKWQQQADNQVATKRRCLREVNEIHELPLTVRTAMEPTLPQRLVDAQRLCDTGPGKVAEGNVVGCGILKPTRRMAASQPPATPFPCCPLPLHCAAMPVFHLVFTLSGRAFRRALLTCPLVFMSCSRHGLWRPLAASLAPYVGRVFVRYSQRP
ncbi:hypothetical protein AK812_SmicGene36281 [Symbiodinium microadriaticum]|uniref:Uncharacterized protein n=1 Tax=Symbiodinium microadriaticum TaxID=2951 RepID=A0A1Q9CJB8_SYMMI|nr:hypothetical protein AK812_SmicGene36281 [Symbiodinium microadriaticum]